MPQCIQCKKELLTEATTCPYCHARQESAASEIGGAVFVLALVFGVCAGFIALVVYSPYVQYCTLAVVGLFILIVLLMSLGQESRAVLHRSRRRFATAFKMTGRKLAEDLHIIKKSDNRPDGDNR